MGSRLWDSEQRLRPAERQWWSQDGAGEFSKGPWRSDPRWKSWIRHRYLQRSALGLFISHSQEAGMAEGQARHVTVGEAEGTALQSLIVVPGISGRRCGTQGLGQEMLKWTGPGPW